MRKALLLFTMVGAVTASYAQLIPKAGVTLSKVAFEESEGVKSKPGFTVGLGYNIKVSGIFSVQPELNFIQKGFKSKSTETSRGSQGTFQSKMKSTINYLEIPVLAKVTFGSGTKFFLNAGPSVGLGLAGKYTFESSTTVGSTATTNKFDGKIKFGKEPDNYKGDDNYIDNRIDFGLQFGGGVIIANKITFDARYGLGVSNLLDKTVDNDKPKSKNQVLQFTVGYLIAK